MSSSVVSPTSIHHVPYPTSPNEQTISIQLRMGMICERAMRASMDAEALLFACSPSTRCISLVRSLNNLIAMVFGSLETLSWWLFVVGLLSLFGCIQGLVFPDVIRKQQFANVQKEGLSRE